MENQNVYAKWHLWAQELQSLAQAGLYYGDNVYDRERYERIRDISAEMMSYHTDTPLETVKELFLAAGFASAETRKDTLGVERVVIGKMYDLDQVF